MGLSVQSVSLVTIGSDGLRDAEASCLFVACFACLTIKDGVLSRSVRIQEPKHIRHVETSKPSTFFTFWFLVIKVYPATKMCKDGPPCEVNIWRVKTVKTVKIYKFRSASEERRRELTQEVLPCYILHDYWIISRYQVRISRKCRLPSMPWWLYWCHWGCCHLFHAILARGMVRWSWMKMVQSSQISQVNGLMPLRPLNFESINHRMKLQQPPTAAMPALLVVRFWNFANWLRFTPMKPAIGSRLSFIVSHMATPEKVWWRVNTVNTWHGHLSQMASGVGKRKSVLQVTDTLQSLRSIRSMWSSWTIMT